MKKKISFFAFILMMAFVTFSSCSLEIGKGDFRKHNLKETVLLYLDTIPEMEYVGMSDTHELDDNRFQAVVIYYVIDSIGNKIEQNARVTTNNDCSEIYTWEDLDCQVLDEAKQKMCDKLEEKGIDINDSLIDALIELKKR